MNHRRAEVVRCLDLHTPACAFGRTYQHAATGLGGRFDGLISASKMSPYPLVRYKVIEAGHTASGSPEAPISWQRYPWTTSLDRKGFGIAGVRTPALSSG